MKGEYIWRIAQGTMMGLGVCVFSGYRANRKAIRAL